MTGVPTPQAHDETALDGNALSGLLLDALGVDLSAARGRCVGCHAVDTLASTVVTLTTMGAVARCRGCDHVLVTLVQGDGRSWVGLGGLAAVEVRTL